MTNAYGYNSWVGYGTETDYGTGVDASHFLELMVGGDGIRHNEEKLNLATTYGLYRLKGNNEQGIIRVGGDLGVEMRFEGMERFLRAALGTVTSTQNGTTSSYTHLYQIADNNLIPMSLHLRRDLNQFRYTGCKVNTLTFRNSVNGFLQMTAGVVGQNSGTVGTSSPTFSTSPLATFDLGAVTFDGTTMYIRDFECTINNNLNTDRYAIGARTVREPVRNGKVEVTGRFAIEFEDLNLYNYFKNATEKQLVVAYTGGTFASSGTNTYLMQMNFPNIRLDEASPIVDNEGLVMIECPFTAYAAATGTREVEITLRNAITAA